MKLSSSLLHSMALGIALTTITATTVSCEKEAKKQYIENKRIKQDKTQTAPTDPCPACGMG